MDQARFDKIFEDLINFFASYKDLSPGEIVGIMHCFIANLSFQAGMDYKGYCNAMTDTAEINKSVWDNNG